MFDNLIDGIKNGFKVANATRKLVFSDKQLFAYPVIAAIVSIVIAVILLVAAFLILISGGTTSIPAAAIVSFIILLIITFFVVYFITTYFTIAMLLAFRSFTSGKRIGMSEALSMTAPYIRLIFEWSVFSVVVATIIHIIEGVIRGIFSRFGPAGNIISGFITGAANIGLAAAVAFALPIIIDEKKGPVETIKLSVGFITKNFGDTFGGLVFAEIFQIVMTLAGIGLIVLGVISGSVLILIVLAIIGLLTIISGVLLRYVLFNCFKLIVYDYKTQKKLPKGFDAKLIDSSIKKKNRPPSGPFGAIPTGI